MSSPGNQEAGDDRPSSGERNTAFRDTHLEPWDKVGMERQSRFVSPTLTADHDVAVRLGRREARFNTEIGESL